MCELMDVSIGAQHLLPLLVYQSNNPTMVGISHKTINYNLVALDHLELKVKNSLQKHLYM